MKLHVESVTFDAEIRRTGDWDRETREPHQPSFADTDVRLIIIDAGT